MAIEQLPNYRIDVNHDAIAYSVVVNGEDQLFNFLDALASKYYRCDIYVEKMKPVVTGG